MLRRRTSHKRYQTSLASFQEWWRTHCRMREEALIVALNAKLRGYCNNYGIRGNYESLASFFYQAKRLLYRQPNRRSQRRRYNWSDFAQLIKVFKLERPRICHNF